MPATNPRRPSVLDAGPMLCECGSTETGERLGARAAVVRQRQLVGWWYGVIVGWRSSASGGLRKRCSAVRIPPHPPQRGRPGPEKELLGHLEAVTLVERTVTGRGRLEVGGHTLAVAPVQDRAHERRPQPTALPLRRDAH